MKTLVKKVSRANSQRKPIRKLNRVVEFKDKDIIKLEGLGEPVKYAVVFQDKDSQFFDSFDDAYDLFVRI